MIVALVYLRDELALGHDYPNCHVRTFIEELGRQLHQHPVLFDHEQKAILREARAIRDDEIDRRSERLDLLSCRAATAVIEVSGEIKYARRDHEED